MGIKKKIKEFIKYCKIGIDKNIESKSYYLMDYFHYYSALAYYEIGDMENYTDCLIKCFNILAFESNEKKMEKFTILINEDFNIKFEEFVINHYSKNKDLSKT